MPKRVQIVHHADRRLDVVMPYAPGILVRGGQLLFLSGLTAAPVYHSHPHREEEFDLPATMREQAVLVMENLKKTLEAAGGGLGDLAFATRDGRRGGARRRGLVRRGACGAEHIDTPGRVTQTTRSEHDSPTPNPEEAA